MEARPAALAAVAAALVVVTAAPVVASASTSTKVTLAVNEITTSFHYLHGGVDSDLAGASSPGDQIVFQSKLVASKKTVGHGSVSCTFAGSSQASIVCTGVYTLPKGSVSFVGQGGQGVLHLPIVGGTGGYVGARGVLVVKDLSESLSKDTFSFVTG